MPLPQTVQGYESEWAILGHRLTETDNVTLDIKDAKLARRLRFRFYGFRRALVKHDASNPWIAALMETQATITPNGDLHFERNPYAAVLRGLLEHSVLKAAAPQESTRPAGFCMTHNQPDPCPQCETGTSNQDQTILDYLSSKPTTKGEVK